MPNVIPKTLELEKVILFHDNILIRPLQKEEVTSNGIILPQTPGGNGSDLRRGYITKVGTGYPLAVEPDTYNKEQKTIPLQSAEGDLALFLISNTIEITYNSETYYIVKESNILLIERDV